MNRLVMNRLVFLISLVILLYAWITATSSVVATFSAPTLSWGPTGTIDFIAYYSANKVFENGGDPYDPQQMLQIQNPLGVNGKPVMIWNPPWTIVMLKPFLNVDFTFGVKLWIVTNFILAITSGIVIWKALTLHVFGEPSRAVFAAGPGRTGQSQWARITYCLVFLSFFPLWNTINFGQTSILLLFGLSLFLWGLEKKNDIIAGLGLVPLTMKPHLVYLFVPVFCWWVIQHKRYRIVISFLAFMALLLFLTDTLHPQAISYWLITILHPQSLSGAIPISGWIGPTAGSMFDAYFGQVWSGARYIPALITALATCSFILRKKPLLVWTRHLGPLLCVSLFTAPWGWVYDQSVLVFMYLGLIYKANQSAANTWRILPYLLGLQAVTFLLVFCGMNAQHQVFWFAPALFILWYHFDKTLNDTRA